MQLLLLLRRRTTTGMFWLAWPAAGRHRWIGAFWPCWDDVWELICLVSGFAMVLAAAFLENVCIEGEMNWELRVEGVYSVYLYISVVCSKVKLRVVIPIIYCSKDCFLWVLTQPPRRAVASLHFGAWHCSFNFVTLHIFHSQHHPPQFIF